MVKIIYRYKIMSSKIFIILCLFSFFTINVSALADENTVCETKTWLDLYQCRVKDICNPYKEWITLAYNVENYKDAENYKTENDEGYSSFEKVKEIYTKNISTIYKCAIINVQKKSLSNLKNKLIPLEKTWTLGNRIKNKIEARIQKVDIQWQSLKCNNDNNKSTYKKLNILKQTTYEMCRYVSYLEYLKWYYDIPAKLLNTENKNEWTYSFSEITRKAIEVENKIEDEKNHTYKVFPLVFHAYSEYANNLSPHLFLELLREDYLVIREKLYKTLTPIDQVGYKIMNAMQQ